MSKWGRPLRWLAIGALLGGTGLRLASLQSRVYWRDEIATSLRLCGVVDSALITKLLGSGPVTGEELLRYQTVGAGGGLASAVGALAAEDAQHAPLYYVMARLWALSFGSSVAALRCFSLVWALLAFWLLQRLCHRLFGDPAVGWVCVTLMSVSPVFARYATEAREYSLWTATLLASTLALLGALRGKSRGLWALYAASTAAALYAFPLSVLFVASQGLYVAGVEKRRSQATDAFLVSASAGLACFLPWAWVMARRVPMILEANSWSGHRQSARSFFHYWLLTTEALFCKVQDFSSENALPAALALALGAFLAYALAELKRSQPREVWLLVYAHLTPFAMAVGLDVLFGGHRSGIYRYNFPLYLGMLLACGHCLARAAKGSWETAARRLALTCVIGLGMTATAVGNGSRTRNVTAMARIIDASERPVVICPLDLTTMVERQSSLGDALSLGRTLARPRPASFYFEDASASPKSAPVAETSFVFLYDRANPHLLRFLKRLERPGLIASRLQSPDPGRGAELWVLAADPAIKRRHARH